MRQPREPRRYAIYRVRLDMYGTRVGVVTARTQREAIAQARFLWGPGTYQANEEA